MFGETKTNKAVTFAAMKNAGIAKAVVHFSGGNDEGGADDIQVTHGDGTTESQDSYGGAHEAYSSWNKDKDGNTFPEGTWIIMAEGQDGTLYHARHYRLATEQEIERAKLTSLLTAPVYDRYGSFAGEFYVDGVVTWDAEAGKVYMGYDEEVPQSEHYEETL
jgi:hypothetical protein